MAEAEVKLAPEAVFLPHLVFSLGFAAAGEDVVFDRGGDVLGAVVRLIDVKAERGSWQPWAE
jgi:hypothetical protein